MIMLDGVHVLATIGGLLAGGFVTFRLWLRLRAGHIERAHDACMRRVGELEHRLDQERARSEQQLADERRRSDERIDRIWARLAVDTGQQP